MNTEEQRILKPGQIEIDGRLFEIVGQEGEIDKGDLVFWNLGTPEKVWRIASVHYCGPPEGDWAYAKPENDPSERYNSSWVCRKIKGWTKVNDIFEPPQNLSSPLF